MKLYHFTSTHHLPAILRGGLILPTESNVGSPFYTMPPFGRHQGPDVVWLLSQPELNGVDHGLSGSVYDKTEIRITVELPQPVKWADWDWTAKMHPAWRDVFAEAGGGPAAVESWYVWPVPIRKRHWVEILHTKSGRTIWPGEGTKA